MFCPSCGNQLSDNSRVCDHCGSEIPSKGYKPPPQGEQQPGSSQTPPPPPPVSVNGSFDPMKWFSEAWKIMQADLTNVIVFNLVYVIVSSILAITVIGILALPGIVAGYMICVIGYVRNKEKLDPGKMLQCGWQYWANVLVYGIVAGLLSGVASICFIIPGFVVGMGFMIPAFMLVDKNTDFSTTFNAAIDLITKKWAGLLVFSLILIAMGVIVVIVSQIVAVCGGIVAFVLSLIVTPLILIASFLAYEELYGQKKAG